AGEIASTHDGLRGTCAGVFESWLGALADDLRAAGAGRAPARETALGVLALLEGAFLLCRTLRSVEPMQAAGEHAARLVAEEVVL
ncbi:MAG: hypothetical protein QOE86_593, partial [Solirubrobacteraceae bacterium]|nr:hypothetical protein [Solirubrobacteraceae bacterium]